MAYVIHLDFVDLHEQADPTRIGFVQEYETTEWNGGVPVQITSHLVATCQDASGMVHAVRLRVEQAALLSGDEVVVRNQVADRAAQARNLVAQALPCPTRMGMVLEPGLYDDLKKTVAHQDIWTWTGSVNDVHARQLVPVAQVRP